MILRIDNAVKGANWRVSDPTLYEHRLGDHEFGCVTPRKLNVPEPPEDRLSETTYHDLKYLHRPANLAQDV